MRIIRDYQRESIDAVLNGVDKGVNRSLCVLATGLGKTFVAGQIMAKYKKVLFITHTEELITQSAKSIILECGDKSVGIIKQERFDIHAHIIVASIQTLWRRLDKIDPNMFDCIIIDEAHYAMASTWLKAANHFTPKLLLGLTATPERLDGISLGNLFREIVIEKGIDFGIENGWLVELEAIRVETHINLDKVRTTGGELNQGDLEKLINTPERNAQIVRKWMEYSRNCTTLGFCVDMQHAVDLCTRFQDEGVKASYLVSDEKLCPDRKYRIEAYKGGDIQVMLNVMILTAGYDHPQVDCIITARPTKSKTIFLQQVGRGTRALCDLNYETIEERVAAIKASTKPKCTILDIADSTSRHQLVNTYTLDKDKPTEKKTFMTREKKKAIADKKATQRKLEHERIIDEVVNLIKLPQVKISGSVRMLEPASEAQLAWLERLGYDIVNITYTKRDCSEIISNAPAADWQIAKLKAMGFDTAGGVKIGQADQILKGEWKPKIKEVSKELQDNLFSSVKLPFNGIT